MASYDFRPALAGTQSVVTHVFGFTVNYAALARMAANGHGHYPTANDAAEPSVPGSRRTTASTITIAAGSPPERT